MRQKKDNEKSLNPYSTGSYVSYTRQRIGLLFCEVTSPSIAQAGLKFTIFLPPITQVLG